MADPYFLKFSKNFGYQTTFRYFESSLSFKDAQLGGVVNVLLGGERIFLARQSHFAALLVS